MAKIRIGCQSYSWQMQGKNWKGKLTDILDVVADAGYEGFECTLQILGDYYNSPERFEEALKERNLKLAALCLGFSCDEPDDLKDKLQAGEKIIKYLKHFPGAVLLLSGGRAESRDDFDKKFNAMCLVYNRIGEMAKEGGIIAGVHPSSHGGSLIDTVSEYDRFLEQTNPELVGFIPDTGHVVSAGYDIEELFNKYYDRMVHIHLKDIDAEGHWSLLGQGICDYKWILGFLTEKEYKGWIILEEESDFAAASTREAVRLNRQFIRELGC
jgi:sugar phosphate isomerase/epimerase